MDPEINAEIQRNLAVLTATYKAAKGPNGQGAMNDLEVAEALASATLEGSVDGVEGAETLISWLIWLLRAGRLGELLAANS